MSERQIVYNLCCKCGKLSMPAFKKPPPFLSELLRFDGDSRSKQFLDRIRQYNSLFAFTSMGADINKHINKGGGPYVFKFHGQVYHRIGLLLPNRGATPKFVELYIHHTQNELSNRINAGMTEDGEKDSGIDRDIADGLMKMLDEYNPLMQTFRMARDRL